MTEFVQAVQAGKIDFKPERLVDLTIVEELEKGGFVDYVYKE